MTIRARILTAVATVAIAAGCGGGGGSHNVPAIQTPLNNQTFASTAAFAYGRKILSNASPAGPATIGTMKVDVGLTLGNLPGLLAYANSASDPASPLYRHFITPDQIGSQYGASTANYNAAVNYFRSQGLSVTGWKTKLMLRVVGPQANMEKAFNTTFVRYVAPNNVAMYGPSGTPRTSIPLAIHSVSHLIYSPSFAKRQALQIPPHGTTPAFDAGYPAQQIADAFDYSGAYAAGYTGTGINIGIIGTGPISQADYNNYKTIFSTGATNTVTQVNVGVAAATNGCATPAPGTSPPAAPCSSTPAPAPSTTPPCNGALPSCNPEDGEAQIDTQQSAALAPGANVLFYLAYIPNECLGGPTSGPNATCYGPQIGISESNDEVQQAINDNNADIISVSYGIAEQYSDYTDNNGVYLPGGIEQVQYAALAAEGIASFISSGDAGAQGCARPYYGNQGSTVITPDQNCVSAPAIDPNVTSVGGITTPVDESGRRIGPFTTWGVQTNHGYGATGGGVSSAGVPLPSWQHGAGIIGNTRNQPDISLEGDPYTGVATVIDFAFSGQGYITGYGGTSVAAPEAAAMWALVLDACRQTSSCAVATGGHPYRMGNAGPKFYNIYNSTTQYPATFYDIVNGNNGVIPCAVGIGVSPCPTVIPSPQPGYNATVGYDHTTGIGVPFARHLIKSVVGI